MMSSKVCFAGWYSRCAGGALTSYVAGPHEKVCPTLAQVGQELSAYAALSRHGMYASSESCTLKSTVMPIRAESLKVLR